MRSLRVIVALAVISAALAGCGGLLHQTASSGQGEGWNDGAVLRMQSREVGRAVGEAIGQVVPQLAAVAAQAIPGIGTAIGAAITAATPTIAQASARLGTDAGGSVGHWLAGLLGLTTGAGVLGTVAARSAGRHIGWDEAVSAGNRGASS